MSLCMMMRSSRTEPPDLTTCVTKTTDDMIESLVCPPPPSDSALNEEAISSLIVPAPKWNKENVSPDGESTAPPSDRSDRSSGHMTSDRGSGIIQSERGSGHIHSSERDSGIGGITIGPISRNRGSNGHTGDMIIGRRHRYTNILEWFNFDIFRQSTSAGCGRPSSAAASPPSCRWVAL